MNRRSALRNPARNTGSGTPGLFVSGATRGLQDLFLGVALTRQESKLVRATGWVWRGGGALTIAVLILYGVIYRASLDYRFEVIALLITWLALMTGGLLLSVVLTRSRASGTPLQEDGTPVQLARAQPAIQGRIDIDRPTEVVFDTVADERNEPRYNPRLRQVDLITPGPFGIGTRFHAETVSMGRTIPMTIEFTDFDRPHRLASTTRMQAMDIRGRLDFVPTLQGTRMNWSWDIQPRGVLALARPIIIRIGRRQEQTIWRALKHYLEDSRPNPDQPGSIDP